MAKKTFSRDYIGKILQAETVIWVTRIMMKTFFAKKYKRNIQRRKKETEKSEERNGILREWRNEKKGKENKEKGKEEK